MFRKKRSLVSRMLLAVVVAAVLAPQGAMAQAKDKVALVRLTHSNGWDALPAVVAHERGFFYDERLVVSGLAVASAEATAKSLVAGSSDMAIVPQRVFIALAEAKLPVKAISVVSWGMPMSLVVRSDGPRSLKDLRNRTIAMARGSDALAYFIRLINQIDLHAKDVKLRYMSTGALTQALKKGQADAVFEIAPYVRAISALGPVRTLQSEEDVRKMLGSIGSVPLVANAKFIEREPDAVQRFVNAWIRALLYMQQNRDDATRLLQLFLHRNGAKVPSDVAASWFQMQRYDRYVWSDNAIADAEYNAWALRETGALKSEVKLKPYIDNRFVTRAVQQLARK